MRKLRVIWIEYMEEVIGSLRYYDITRYMTFDALGPRETGLCVRADKNTVIL